MLTSTAVTRIVVAKLDPHNDAGCVVSFITLTNYSQEKSHLSNEHGVLYTSIVKSRRTLTVITRMVIRTIGKMYDTIDTMCH